MWFSFNTVRRRAFVALQNTVAIAFNDGTLITKISVQVALLKEAAGSDARHKKALDDGALLLGACVAASGTPTKGTHIHTCTTRNTYTYTHTHNNTHTHNTHNTYSTHFWL